MWNLTRNKQPTMSFLERCLTYLSVLRVDWHLFYSQTHSSVTTRLSFWQLFINKFLISFVNRSISFVYQMQKAWNRSLSTAEYWKNILLCKKLNFTKIWSGIKFIYCQYAFVYVSILTNSCPLPTLKFDKQTCNVFHLLLHACSENLIGTFQTGSCQTNQKLVKKVSKT